MQELAAIIDKQGAKLKRFRAKLTTCEGKSFTIFESLQENNYSTILKILYDIQHFDVAFSRAIQ